ncbi:hypothetical protein FGO68_gene2170 [Halteria grandinella]|uniref:Uncharacterized protein n=1 Tax=Halteria grandinella TaxID=5974 RepID=A0A8J8P3X4_HALGN|nr:hypothetical protein FGO68_gene2170 [Halteria grandinella]
MYSGTPVVQQQKLKQVQQQYQPTNVVTLSTDPSEIQSLISKKEEEEKRTRELIDQLLAQEMQDQFEKEDQMIQENIAIHASAADQNRKKNNHAGLPQPNPVQREQQQRPIERPQPVSQVQRPQTLPQQQQSKPVQRYQPPAQSPYSQPKPEIKQQPPPQPQKQPEEKSANKFTSFFKNAFQKIEDSFNQADAKPTHQTQQQAKKEETKAAINPYTQQAKQAPQTMPPQSVKPQLQQQNVPTHANYANASPVKRPRPSAYEEKEIIEEILFHHPVVSSLVSNNTTPTKYFKDLIPPVDDSPVQQLGAQADKSQNGNAKPKPQNYQVRYPLDNEDGLEEIIDFSLPNGLQQQQQQQQLRISGNARKQHHRV